MLKLVLFVTCLIQFLTAKDVPSSPSQVLIHVTNRTEVPSVHHIVDAVECLRQAYFIYTDPLEKAKLYAELFQEKHNETEWNVVTGYTAAYIQSQWYIETSVASSGKDKDSKKDDSEKEIRFLIFSKV